MREGYHTRAIGVITLVCSRNSLSQEISIATSPLLAREHAAKLCRCTQEVN